jgi:hypothetical protein
MRSSGRRDVEVDREAAHRTDDDDGEPSLSTLITFALAEATWAEQAIHPTMTATLRRHHEHHAHMHHVIAQRLEELKELETR